MKRDTIAPQPRKSYLELQAEYDSEQSSKRINISVIVVDPPLMNDGEVNDGESYDQLLSCSSE